MKKAHFLYHWCRYGYIRVLSRKCTKFQLNKAFWYTMYILACNFFSKKTLNTYLKLKIRVVYRKFFTVKYVFIVFIQNKSYIIFLYIRNLENSCLKIKPGFPVQNIHFYLCGQVVNTKGISCSRKQVLNVSFSDL